MLHIVPSGGLACLIAKATTDESNKWHRRLGHVNFKNLNKLVKGNLVRGLPSKIFQNDHTCVACQKGKQHKASYKAKTVSSISHSLQLLHMDLFGPTSVRSLNHKTYAKFTDRIYRVHGLTSQKLENCVNVSPIPTSRIHSNSSLKHYSRDQTQQCKQEANFTKVLELMLLLAMFKSKEEIIIRTSSTIYLLVSCLNMNPRRFQKLLKMKAGLMLRKKNCCKFEIRKFVFLVYVDDTNLGSTKKSWCDEFEALMKSRFQMSSMGELTFFLGLQVKTEEDGIFISHEKFQVTPKSSHLSDVKRIFRYLKGKPKLGLWYPRVSLFDLESYSDSDYAGANLDRKSTTGGCQFLGRRLISWQCKKQTIVATSTTETEYVAAASCRGQVLWIQNKMLDYGFNFMNTKIYIDNESTICIVKNPVYHSKTKHIAIRHHFIRDAYEKKLIQATVIYSSRTHTDKPIVSTDGSIISTDEQVEGTDEHKECTEEHNESTEEQREGTEEKVESTDGQRKGNEDQTEEEIAAQQTQTPTKTHTSTVFGDDETIAKVLLNISQAKAVFREKEKGVELKDIEEADRPRPTSKISLLTLKPLPKIDPKDKGKKKIEEEDESESESDGIPQAEKKFKQLESDEELARKMQEEWKEEEERNKIAEEKAANEALIRNFDDIKARIEADRLLAEKLQEQEREQFTIEERAKFLHDTIAAQRRFLAQQRSEAIRNKPPTKNQLRNQMMTYLKHVGNYKHAELKVKKFEEVQALYEKIKRSDEDFISIGSAEDERLIKKMNEKGVDLSKSEVIKEESKEEVQKENKEDESTRKRKLGTRKKMKSRKRRYIQNTSEDDSDKENDELRLHLTIAPIKKRSDFGRDCQDEIPEGFDRDWNIVSWKLHSSSGVHTLVTKTGLIIHMLVEKRYPLRKEILMQMLKLKLESEEDSTMALELIRFIKKILAELESEG
ncbi:putative ribonuclease H-like domain-containing protein [Tanacetum coccineum]|uniref:Ribonuclease H-like domain-containing protein n=1 Tax=Tanacetum coccineum TaxID=301880 RepID=A0ABQ5FZR3_9ASTR